MFSSIGSTLAGGGTGSGMRRQTVIDYVDNTAAPPTEVLNDRYLLDDTGVSHANWDGVPALSIAIFDGTIWVARSPIEGMRVYVDAEDAERVYVDDPAAAWEVRDYPVPEADVTFDDATGHAHTGAAGNGTVVAHSDTSGKTTDDHHAKQHALGAAADHTSATLAELNALISDANLKNDIQLSWNGVSTAANDYVVAARFIFRGTTLLGTPASMKAAVVLSGANPGDIQIFDFTNSLQIVEKTGISNTAVAVVDLGSLSNLPAGEAVFELQIRVPAVGAVSISVFSLGVFF